MQEQRYNNINQSFIYSINIPLSIALNTKLYRVRDSCQFNPKTLGQFIRKSRIECDLWAKELAERVGCTFGFGKKI